MKFLLSHSLNINNAFKWSLKTSYNLAHERVYILLQMSLLNSNC